MQIPEGERGTLAGAETKHTTLNMSLLLLLLLLLLQFPGSKRSTLLAVSALLLWEVRCHYLFKLN